MVLQAYVDESVTPGGVIAFAGYVASVEAWAKFSEEWEELLPLAKVSEGGRRRFKMSEMVTRMDNVKAFYRVDRKICQFEYRFCFQHERLRERAWAYLDTRCF